MAASSSENNSYAPSEFDISSSFGSSSGLIAVERCPVCDYSKRPFHCRTCVNQGLFIHSKGSYPERYTDKSYRLEILTKQRNSIINQVEVAVQKKYLIDRKKCEIDDCRRKIQLLKLALQATKTAQLTGHQAYETTVKENQARKVKARTHQKKMLKIKEYVESTRETSSQKIQVLNTVIENLALERKKHLSIITQFIFPFEEIKNYSCSAENTLAASTENAIRDASHTAYIRGRWVYTDGSEEGDTHYCLIEPTLPCNGDLSAYILWVANSRENNGNPDNSLRNPGHRISAALCYAGQLTSIVSSILDVPLPHKQNYSVFCGVEMAEKHFKNCVACLNQNILYLCFSQGLGDTELIEPKNTLGNLYLLIKHTNTGTLQPFTINLTLLQSVGEITYSQEEEEKCFPLDVWEGEPGLLSDWEEVPHDFMESDITSRTIYNSTSNIQSMTYPRPPSDPSQLTASGLMSSAAASFVSLFRGPANTKR